VTSLDVTDSARRPFPGRRVRLGDFLLQGVAGIAALGSLVLIGLIAWKVIQGARLSISTFGLSFVWHVAWDPVHGDFGAGAFLYGTAITSISALVIATPIAIGIALFLSELAPRGVRGPVTALVETLAAIPSVVIGLWGLLVLAPVLLYHVDPALHSVFGFIPLFGHATYGSNIFTAIIVLTIMILPIIASISRELFLSVPSELKEGALGLGTTRWEMIRGVVLPYTRGGVAAAMILGLGRALGEAIAVALVIGSSTGAITASIFNPGNTLASWIAQQYAGLSTPLATSSLMYMALILLVFSIIVNLVAQGIVRRAARRQGLSR